MLRLLEDVPNMGGVKNMHVQYFSWKTWRENLVMEGRIILKWILEK
jgi:hypothetical protein